MGTGGKKMREGGEKAVRKPFSLAAKFHAHWAAYARAAPRRFRWASLLAGAAFASPQSALAQASACAEFNGEARPGALLWARLPAAAGAAWLGEERLKISPEGVVVFGFGRNETGAVEFRVTARSESGGRDAGDAGSESGGRDAGDANSERNASDANSESHKSGAICRTLLTIAPRDYPVSRVEGVPQRTVAPGPEHLARIRRERELVRAAKAASRPEAEFADGFQWPLLGRISGVYGSVRYYNGKAGRPHYGVDVARPEGTPVAAPAPGTVTLAEPDLFYSGGTVIIDHGSEVSSSFLHLSAVAVAAGQRVRPGDIIGEVGATGRATGPHLDWRMTWRNRRIDPQLLVPPMPSP